MQDKSNEPDLNADSAEGRPRKPYVAPELVKVGSAGEITKSAATTSGSDGAYS